MSVAFVAVTCSARWRSRRLQRSARIETCVGEHRCLADATLVVLPTDAVVAYAAPGAPPQVVVSRGLVGALTSDELDAVVRHELTHLRNGHHRDLVLAGVVDATLGWPWAAGQHRRARLSLERSADEVAADQPGARMPFAARSSRRPRRSWAPFRAFGGVQPVGPARGPGDASS